MSKFFLILIMGAGLVAIIFGGMSLLNFNLASLYGVLTATVTINPLEVEVAAPSEVEINRTFIVRAEVENKGSQRIEAAEAEIFLPEGLATKKDKEQKTGDLAGESKKTIVWPVKGEKIGNYVVAVKVSGGLAGKELDKEGSTMIEVQEGKFDFFPKWFNIFFRWF